MRIVGADAQAPRTGAGREWGAMNYYAGRDHDRWIRGVQSFDQVKYESVYPGIDLIYYGAGRHLEYRFVVAPGADPSTIEIAFDGARQVSVSPAGELIIEARRRELRQRPPRIYQRTGDGVRRAVIGGFALTGQNRVAFTVTKYDRARPLVIE